jgi:hypothetical protein
MEMLGLTSHDLMMIFVWPVLTAALNAGVMLLGKSDKPWAQFLSNVGTSLLKQKSK